MGSIIDFERRIGREVSRASILLDLPLPSKKGLPTSENCLSRIEPGISSIADQCAVCYAMLALNKLQHIVSIKALADWLTSNLKITSLFVFIVTHNNL